MFWMNYMSRDIWLISDTHFGHKNIIKFTSKVRVCGEDLEVPIRQRPDKAYPNQRRPFNDIHEHNQYLTEKWNSVVKPQDHVWHGGDFGSFSAKRHLNGVINLIVGNHDEDFQHYVNGETTEYIVDADGNFVPDDDPRLTKMIPLKCSGLRKVQKKTPGFKKIRECRLWSEYEHGIAGLRFLQTHRPSNMLRGGDPHRRFQFNVHGHTHGHKVQLMGSEDSMFYNISVECLEDYTPVHLEDVAKELKKRL